MKILVNPGLTYQCVSTDKPVEGRYYSLTEYEPGTDEQNRAFHALLNAFFDWMFKTNTFVFEDYGITYDLRAPDAEMFKMQFKYKYGAGAKYHAYFDEGRWQYVKKLDDIPLPIVKRYNEGERWLITWKNLKTWSEYTKRQRTDTIDKLLTIIAISGCDDKKVHEIIDGMAEKSMEREMDKMRRK